MINQVAYLDVGQFLKLGIGLTNVRVGLKFQGYSGIALLQLISKILITLQKTN